MQEFGVTSKGEKASLYTIRNNNCMQIAVTDYGAALVKVLVPDREGKLQDVVCGYDDVTGYENSGTYFGATIGRVANRIGGASFTLNGKEYPLTANDGENSLHGGRDYTNKRMWKVEEASESQITFLLYSPDGDQGYPGDVDVKVTYKLTDDNEIVIHYSAVSSQDTLLNFTNHSYFNLSGHQTENVLDQEVRICADAFTRADAQSIPTGEIVSVEGTPMDFRKMKKVGKDIDEEYEALIFGHGYDHNWVLNGSGMREVAAMHSDETGITMEVFTDLPGMQFYTANFVEDEHGKDGVVYGKRCGACFETQYFPDAVHKEHFEGPVVRAGEVYDTTTIYKLS